MAGRRRAPVDRMLCGGHHRRKVPRCGGSAGRHEAAVPRSKRLLSDGGSNVLVYLTGHGGDDFLKFQDQEEMMGAVRRRRNARGRES